MIDAEVAGNDVVLAATLSPGSFAYVDRDWLPASSQTVPSLSVSPDGWVAWCEGSLRQAPNATDPDTAAALALLSVAREASAVVEGLPSGTVEVIGNGVIARLVRVVVGNAAHGAGRTPVPPRAIVETTGDAQTIVDATRRLEDLGTLVLVGEALGRIVEMDLYADVHVRGLTLVGVSPPLYDGEFPQAQADDDRLLDACRASLARVSSRRMLPPGAAWYRVSS